MTDLELEKLKDKLAAHHARERAALEKKQSAEREALEILGPTLFDALNSPPTPNNNGMQRRKFSKIITELIPELKEPIDINSVIGELKTRYQMTDINPTSISGVLRKLAESDGPLEVLEEGSGRRATTYKRRVKENASLELAS